jgi:tripartite-type tricarboxylate transporter receptor subunit TctC
MSTLRLALAAGLAIALACYDGWAQSQRTVKFVIPFPPGGAADTRLIHRQNALGFEDLANVPGIFIERCRQFV